MERLSRVDGGTRPSMPTLPRALRYALVGGLNTAVDLLVFSSLVFAVAWGPAASNVVSYATGVLTSFFHNRAWTFSDRGTSKWLPQFAAFLVLNVGLMLLSTLLVLLLASVVPPLAAKAASLAVTFVLGYTIAKNAIFGERSAAA